MPESVIELALDQVADRTPIDWEALERSLNSADDRRWLDCVRVLEDIANFHRSPIEDDQLVIHYQPLLDLDHRG